MIDNIELYPEINHDYIKYVDYNLTIEDNKKEIIATCEERKDYDNSRELKTR